MRMGEPPGGVTPQASCGVPTLMRLRSAACVGAALFVSGCGASAAPISAITALTGDPLKGESVYGAQCGSCHGADAVSGSARRDLPRAAHGTASRFVEIVLDGQEE